MSQEVGTGPGGTVVPGDLDGELPGDLQEKLEDEAAALGNGSDSGGEEAPASGNGGGVPDASPADRGDGEDRDWTEIDRHTERVLDVLRRVLANMDEKGELILGKLLKKTEEELKGALRDLKLHVTGSVGMAGREQAAAAWRGPAEALRLLGGVLTGLSEKAGQDAIETNEFTAMFPVLKTAEELLLRACQHEEGRLPVAPFDPKATRPWIGSLLKICSLRMMGAALPWACGPHWGCAATWGTSLRSAHSAKSLS